MHPFDADAFRFVLPTLSGRVSSWSVQVAVRPTEALGEWTEQASLAPAPWAPDLSTLRWQRLELVVRQRAA